LVNLRDGQNLNGRVGIALSATASATAGTISKVEYFVGNVKVGEGSGVNFDFLWTPPTSGPFEIVAKAYDSNGQESYTRTIPIIVTHVGTYVSPVLGSYFGLVRGQTFNFNNDGYVTMTTTTTGSFTLKLLTGGKTWSSPAAKFDANGNATVTISRGVGVKPLTVVLAHSTTPPVDQIHGRVADGPFANGKFSTHTFQTEFTVDRVVWSATKKPATMAGPYTILLPADDNAVAQGAPRGTGFATATVTTAGAVTLIGGSLPDGTTVTQSSFVSKDGLWPVYAPLYATKGVLMGQMNFTSLAGISDVDGPLTWMRPADAKSLIYKPGFTTELDGVGSKFVKAVTYRRLIPLQNVGGNAMIHLEEGGLTSPMARLATVNSANLANVPLQDADRSTLTIAGATGLVTGNFYHPVTQKLTAYKGAVLQTQKLMGGYFLEGTHGGKMSLGANAAYPPALSDANAIGVAPLPTVTISAPTANAIITKFVAGAVVVTGKAVDKQGIASVQIQVLHNGVLSTPTPATVGIVVPATGTTNWTYNIPIGVGEGGHYTIMAKSVDTLGQQSEVLSVPFLVPLKSALTVAVNDAAKGKVSTGFLGSTQRDVGKTLSVTATPVAKKKFLGWTGSVVSSAPTITVLMKVGTTLTANFGD
ncbi:MAG: Ig-like domain-containing protein, partial [Prosthecobacter sp.]